MSFSYVSTNDLISLFSPLFYELFSNGIRLKTYCAGDLLGHGLYGNRLPKAKLKICGPRLRLTRR